MQLSTSTVICSVACLTLLLGIPLSDLSGEAPHRETVAPGPTAPPVHPAAAPDVERPPGTPGSADRMPMARPAPNAGRPAVRHRVPSDPQGCATLLPGGQRPLPVTDCRLPVQPAPRPTARAPRTI
ncbi:hypothetical protein [Kitasatospora sp. NPDC047058]|uniref:hypothetical protein n=1 Tax=Kitasatospora sp. NPDC047058 TaxID=3155620 RepID=UPI0033F48EB0